MDEHAITHTYAQWTLEIGCEHYVQIGSTKYDIDPETGYEGYLYVQSVKSASGSALNYRVYEKIMWGSDNYIELMANERATAKMVEGSLEFYASGTITGKGVVDGQSVKISGIREGFIDYVTLDFILDNVGLLQYVGN